MFVNYRTRLLEDLLGIQEEILTVNDELFDIWAGTRKASKSRLRTLNRLLSDLHAVQEKTASRLKSLGMSLATVGDSYGERYVPLVPNEGVPIEAAQTPQPSNWKKYGAYFAAGIMIGAAVLGFWGTPLILKSWSSGKVDYTHPTNETTNKRREGENNTTETPETPYQSPMQNQTQNQTQNPQPVNQTPINQTQINQTLDDVVNTPDYLKYLRGVFTGDTFIGNYGIADAEHNPGGNYTLRVRDSSNRTIFETDLNDSESDHGRFWFGTNGFKQNMDYFVEVLRNGTLAHESLKFTIPNNPPSVKISANAELDKDQRFIDYTLQVSDDRQVVDAEISLVNASGGNVILLEKFNVNKQGQRLGGILVVDKNVPAGTYHVLAKARDNEGSYSEAVVDVDLPELPIPPPPPPPPPHVNIPPQIVGAAWSYDKDRDKFVADVDVTDPDGPNLSLEQKLLDNGSNVNTPMTSQVSGSRIHSEVNAQGLDSVYDWNLTVKDGANGTATQLLKNVWAWMRGLAGYWKFDGNGTDCINGNNATLQNGAGFAQGKKGQALSLDGTDQYATMTDKAAYDSDSFSISLWFNASELLGKNYRSLIKKGDNTGTNLGWLMMTGSDAPSSGFPQDRIMIIGWDGGQWKLIGQTPQIQKDTQYHISFVYDSIAKKTQTYLNGQLVDTEDVSGSIIKNTKPLEAGYKFLADSNSNSWNGTLDDLRFYSKALTNKEVQAIFAED